MSTGIDGYDVEMIKEVLPHRFPFLLVDRILGVKAGPNPNSREGRTVTAVKCVTINEPMFQGHFPERSIFPGVLIVEAMAQAGAFAFFQPNDDAFEIMIASISGAKFRRPVVPGDRMEIIVTVEKDRGKMILLDGYAQVDGKKVAEAKVMAYVSLAKGN